MKDYPTLKLADCGPSALKMLDLLDNDDVLIQTFDVNDGEW